MTQNELIKFIKYSNLIEDINDCWEIPRSIKAWNIIKNKSKLTKKNILSVHYAIMRDLNREIAGKFRNILVRVGNRICPDPIVVEALIDGWIQKYDKGIKNEGEDKEAHIAFEYIHPFVDGNGRTGRLLWLWHREKAKLPFRYIEYEKRFDYYRWFDKEVKKDEQNRK